MLKSYLTLFVLILYLAAACKLQQHDANANLHGAVKANQESAVKKYLRKGASVNYREKKRGWTALLFAVETGNTAIVKMLIDDGADVNMLSLSDRVSPLQRAASSGSTNMIKLLIDNGADLDHQDKQLRSTPLMWASVNGHEEAARLLLDKGALINVRGNRGESALFLAVSAQRANLVELLISFNAISDRPDIYGVTPLQKATELENDDIVNLLRK